MGFLDEYIEVKIGSRNIEYYENLGYKIPRVQRVYYNEKFKTTTKRFVIEKGTKIIVKREDISQGSKIKLRYSCDKCNKILYITKFDYKEHNHEGKYYCVKCSSELFNSKDKHPFWNPLKDENDRIIERHYPEYNDFVRSVLKRDGYTCVKCGSNKKLRVHHLDGYDWCKEKRTDVENGVCLCEECHMNFHYFYGMGNNTKEQFEEWFNKDLSFLKDEFGEILRTKRAICLETNEIIENINKISSKIYDVCNKTMLTYRSKHYMWYDEYLESSQEEINEYLNKELPRGNKKYIVCKELKLLFDSFSDAGEYLNLNPSMLSDVINGKQKTFGGYHWCLKENYDKDINELYHILTEECKKSIIDTNIFNRVVCVEDKLIFEQKKDIAYYEGTEYSGAIVTNIKNNKKYHNKTYIMLRDYKGDISDFRLISHEECVEKLNNKKKGGGK